MRALSEVCPLLRCSGLCTLIMVVTRVATRTASKLDLKKDFQILSRKLYDHGVPLVFVVIVR